MNTTPSTDPRFPTRLGSALGFRGRSGKTLVLVVGVSVVVVVVFALLLYNRGTPLSLPLPVRDGVSKVTNVPLTTEYQNPFERETQYVNPFQEFKSPFQSLQQ